MHLLDHSLNQSIPLNLSLAQSNDLGVSLFLILFATTGTNVCESSEFPTSLSALQRRQVHAWAMQLALFHASSGDDAQRHVIISKTGENTSHVTTHSVPCLEQN